MLVLLLRLRQICCHPCLIQEDGVTYIGPDEVNDEDMNPDVRDELARARELVSSAFVSKMREKLKDSALRRMSAEKEVSQRCFAYVTSSNHKYFKVCGCNCR